MGRSPIGGVSQFWPSKLPVVDVLRAAGIEDVTSVPCPICNTLLHSTRSAQDGETWFVCRRSSLGNHVDRCFRGTAFEILLHRSRLVADAQALDKAFDVLAAHKVKVGKVMRSPRGQRGYAEHVRQMARFHDFQTRMELRSQSLAFGKDHNHPYWWHASVGELENGLEWRLRNRADSVDALLTVVPGTDSLGRFVGAYTEYRESAAQPVARTKVVPGTLGGIGFRETLAYGTGPALLYADVSSALALHKLAQAERNKPLPVAAILSPITVDTAPAVAADLPARTWVYVSSSAPHLSPGEFLLCSRLAAYVAVSAASTGAVRYAHTNNNQTAGVGTQTDPSGWWVNVLGRTIGALPASSIKSLLHHLNWGELRTLAARYWNADLVHKADAIMRASSALRVEVRPGLTVLDSDGGWWWVERNCYLWTMPPRVHKVYRDESGRLVHSGDVRHPNGMIPFKTAKLRKDPVGVIEAAVLRSHASFVLAPPHPAIVPHIAAVACYFGMSSA